MAMYGVTPTLPLAPQGGPDEDLMAGLQNTRSQIASGVQSAGAQMGVPGQAPAGARAPGVGGRQPPSQLQRMMEQRQQQATELQSQQEGVALGQRLVQALDPRVPRQARQFLLRQISQGVGVDPRGTAAKEFIGMVSSLDPQTLETMRTNITPAIQSNPGQVVQLVKGALSGQVPAQQIVQTMIQAPPPSGGEGAVPPARGPTKTPPAGGDRPAGMMRLGGPVATPLVTGASQLGPVGSTPGPAAPGPARMPFEAAPPPAAAPLPIERQVAPVQREIAPELANLLGLDSSERYRNRDVIAAGWRRIPTQYEDQQRLATDIRGYQDGVINTMMLSNQLANLVRGRPESLDQVRFRVPFSGEVIPVNIPALGEQIAQVFRGIGRTTGLDEMLQISSGPSSADTPALTRAIDRVTQHVRALEGESGARGTDAAVVNARIRSLIVPLAFQMAAAAGQTGRFLSDRDVELMLNQIGISASPIQMETAIRDLVSRTYRGYNTRMQVQTGGQVPLEPGITSDVGEILRTGGVTPQELITRLYGEGVSAAPTLQRPPIRSNLLGGRQIPGENVPLPPTFSREYEEAGVPLPTPVQNIRPVETIEGGAPPIPEGGAVGKDPAPVMRPIEPIRIPRQGRTIQQDEAEAQSRVEEDRAARLAAQSADRRRLELAESAEQRAARGEVFQREEARRRRIQDAFQAIAQALRSSGGSAGSVGTGAGAAGGDQDAAAFRIAPAPQRRAPDPIDASRFRQRQ